MGHCFSSSKRVPSFLPTSDLQEVFKACAATATLTDASDAFAAVDPAGDQEEEEEEERSFAQTAQLRNTRRRLAVDVSGAVDLGYRNAAYASQSGFTVLSPLLSSLFELGSDISLGETLLLSWQLRFWTPYLAPPPLLGHHLLPLPCSPHHPLRRKNDFTREKKEPRLRCTQQHRGRPPHSILGVSYSPAASSFFAAAGCVKSIRSITRRAPGGWPATANRARNHR